VEEVNRRMQNYEKENSKLEQENQHLKLKMKSQWIHLQAKYRTPKTVARCKQAM
jgi:hypothetical protein